MKNGGLLETLTTFRRIFCILRCLDIRPDMGHRETLVLFACTGRTLSEILLTFVKGVFLSTINAHIFSWAHFLSCGVSFLFSQSNHQKSHSAGTYLSLVFVQIGGFKINC